MYIVIFWMFKIVLDGDFTSSTVQKYLDYILQLYIGRVARDGRFAFFTLESI